MFRQAEQWFVKQLGLNAGGAVSDADATDFLWRLHPVPLLRFLEEAWAYRLAPQARPDAELPPALLYGLVPGLQSGLADLLPGVTTDIFNPVPDRATAGDGGGGADWDHLIYAYLIESTTVVEVLRRVLVEYLHGERLETPSPTTHRWLRTTEDLFFRDLPSGSIGAVTSSIRPDPAATRRNAYHRMFGSELPFGLPDGRPYPFAHAAAANTAFWPMFEDFLREVWIAAENFTNTSGSNPKDDAAIASFARDLRDMLLTRRSNGNLAREEFWVVSTMSWFHLTVESNNAVVTDLKATAGSPEERLRKIAERVGLKPSRYSESFFLLAPRMSALLKRIESGDFNDPGNVQALYLDNPPGTNLLRRDMLDIINQWSLATGRDMKARRTTPTARTPAPRSPVPAAQSAQRPGDRPRQPQP